MTDDPKAKAREYLRRRGTAAAASAVRAHVAEAFDRLEKFLADVPVALVPRRALPDEWSIQEIVDHLVETHRPGVDELRCLLAGQRPPGPPIPAGLQSKAPLLRPWAWLRRELATVHADILELLDHAVAANVTSDVRAELVMVVNVTNDRGETTPDEWIEELDWRAYAIVWRLHVLDHLHQARTVVGALG